MQLLPATLYAPAAPSDSSGFWAAIIVALIVVLTATLVASLWRLFTKAGRSGWASLIPLYNVIVLLSIIGRPWWYIVFLFIPGANAVLAVVLCFGAARSFGKGWPFAVGMILLPVIFLPLLAFGGARYVGPMGPNYRRGPALPRQA